MRGLVFPVILCVFACNHSDENERSTFKAEDNRAREASGIVYRGERFVPNALVRVETSEGIANPIPGFNVLTDLAGAYGGQPLDNVALRYDLTTVLEGAILTYRNLGYRFVTPSLELAERSPPRSYRVPLDVHFDSVIPPEHDIAFVVAGDQTFGIEGTFGSPLTLVTTSFQAGATIHAIEYERGKDFRTAVNHAKVFVNAVPDTTTLVSLHLAPIDKFFDVTLQASVPAGYPVPATGEVYAFYSRTSYVKYADFPLNERQLHLPFLPDSGMNYRVHATDGVSSMDSGEKSYPVFDKANTIAELFVLPALVTPAEGETLPIDGVLVASGNGLFEHVLVPEKGGTEIRIIADKQSIARLPSFAAVNMTPPSGRYKWTVRSYPKLTHPEQLGGIDVRRFQPMSTSAPRTIAFP